MATSLGSLLVAESFLIRAGIANVLAHSQKLELQLNLKNENSKNRWNRNKNKNFRGGLNSLKNDYNNMKDKRMYQMQSWFKIFSKRNQRHKWAEVLASIKRRLKPKTWFLSKVENLVQLSKLIPSWFLTLQTACTKNSTRII